MDAYNQYFNHTTLNKGPGFDKDVQKRHPAHMIIDRTSKITPNHIRFRIDPMKKLSTDLYEAYKAIFIRVFREPLRKWFYAYHTKKP